MPMMKNQKTRITGMRGERYGYIKIAQMLGFFRKGDIQRCLERLKEIDASSTEKLS